MIPLLKFAIDAYCHSDRQNLALIEPKARIAAQRARLDNGDLETFARKTPGDRRAVATAGTDTNNPSDTLVLNPFSILTNRHFNGSHHVQS